MMRIVRRIGMFGASSAFGFLLAASALAFTVPDRLFTVPDSGPNPGPPSTVNILPFATVPLTDPFTIEETNMMPSFPPVNEEGGKFEANENLARFKLSTDPTSGPLDGRFGHKFQRDEAWDVAFDVKIETPNPQVRKEAGFYFENTALGASIWFAGTSKDGYGPGPGPIAIVQTDIIPNYTFSGGDPLLGDYNHNEVVDAADYTIWRDTLGSTTDFRANGNNEGESLDKIDQADYDVWKMNFGDVPAPAAATYTVGDTLNMRAVYTPPILTTPGLPATANDPNVVTPGTLEYIIKYNGGPAISSGPLDFVNSWKGIPNGTLISLRSQNLSTAEFSPDSGKATFSNFDFNGDLPGSGIGAGAGAFAGAVPEPASLVLLGIALGLSGRGRRRNA